MSFLIRGPLITCRHHPVLPAHWLDLQRNSPCTYSPLEPTRTTETIPGFQRDFYRICLGDRLGLLSQAREAVSRWVMFDLGWTRMLRAPQPPAPGDLAVVAIRYAAWWINCCRIVYVVDTPTRYGFAYGTLSGHVEAGEELFFVEQKNDGSVWFEIHAFSRPRHILTWLGYPLVRLLQKRFGRQACARMRQEMDGICV